MADALNLSLDLSPVPWGGGDLSATWQNISLDASTDRVAWVWHCGGNITITIAGFRVNTSTGTPPTYKISIQGVDGSGLPDGTIKGGGSPASATFTPPADTTWNATFQNITLDNSYAAGNEALAIVVEYESGTINGSNFTSFTHSNSSGRFPSRIPYALTDTDDSWTIGDKYGFGHPVWGYSTASKAYGIPLEGTPIPSLTTQNHRNAIKFTLPAGWGDTFKIAGGDFGSGFTTTSGKLYKLGIWEGTTEKQSVTNIDNDWGKAVLGNSGLSRFRFDESSLATLNFGTAYYLGIELSDASPGTVFSRVYEVAAAADWDAFQLEQNCEFATFNATSWTDVPTQRAFGRLLLADITEPAGGLSARAVIVQGIGTF